MESIWSRSCQINERNSLEGSIEVDTVVIGAGLCGILTAYKLQERGKACIVVDKNTIASGQTKNTTAKITSQHGLIYHKLIETLGTEKARQYATANQQAVEEYERIITQNRLGCNFEKKDAYLYSIKNEKAMMEEAAAAKLLGLPASFVAKINLPFDVAGAVKFENQAQFNPLKFIKEISKDLTIYENTNVISVEENTIITDKGVIIAKQIVFACHFPFINFPGLYFARMHQERSYAIALQDALQVDGMYISADCGGYSFRNYKDYLLMGGENHRTGENSEGGRYDNLILKAKELFPTSKATLHWSAQDCMTTDSIPYIGQYSMDTPNWYVATGFNKWGMTTSMVSATILSEIICGVKNRNSDVFSPSRFSLEDIPKIAIEGVQAIKGLARENFNVPKTTLDELPLGHGGIILVEGEKVGVYKESKEKVHIVTTRCPHLGCQLEWNVDEKSWDCPCHGSRFDYRGKLINNPAQEGINFEKLL